jgi:hypothetical protein
LGDWGELSVANLRQTLAQLMAWPWNKCQHVEPSFVKVCVIF